MRPIAPRGGLYLPDAVRAIQSRYEFVKAPIAMEELDPGKGISFLHGKFQTANGPVVINRFQYFDNAITAENGSNTDDLDQFLQELIQWMLDEFSLNPNFTDFPNWYDSQVEVALEIEIGETQSEAEREISDTLNRIVSGYGHHASMRPSGMVYSFDPSELRLHGFSLDRRAEQPFSANLYWSRAPLQTNHHLEVLSLIEKLGKSAQG